jgi:mRNA-decapping enzyme subunit 2
LPDEELRSTERICFQVEEAQWFYEDFIRPLDPSLPSLSLRAFSLRIFQHCPIFREWNAQEQSAAFAEFLAYKQRVPVRGAILLNEAMDEVVLVKGWKKSANWSFPRGKINKDENDLDCAVREVYEETGFDARAAGVVKDEKDMKAIDITMREQHMRLFVFPGVSKDTHFEAKTRKEISKIEWYKLTDLPTLKKKHQHEGSGTDHAAINANKFYMVAPFLNPLKKWIVQQKKKGNRFSSHLSAPPIVAEDMTTEDERDHSVALSGMLAPQPIVSDLPEVSAPSTMDQTASLKEMFNMGPSKQLPIAAPPPSSAAPVDAQKSNALLALLRGAPSKGQDHFNVVPHAPLDQLSVPAEMQHSPHVSHVKQLQIDQQRPPSVIQPQVPSSDHYHPGFGTIGHSSAHNGTYLQQEAPQPVQQIAPYQRTGDPLSVPGGQQQSFNRAVPPASALPKLTNHTKSLLDAFRTPSISLASNPPNQASPASTAPQTTAPAQQLASRLPSVDAQEQNSARRAQASYPTGAQPMLPPQLGVADQVSPLFAEKNPNAKQNSLLGLFNQPSTPKAEPSSISRAPPAELAATTATPLAVSPQTQKTKDESLLALLRGQTSRAEIQAPEPKRTLPREGETAATINGPLNQPEFDIFSRTVKHTGNEMGRSPLTSNRTLYDPNAPPPVKILSRPEELRPQPPRSPRSMKPTSSKKAVKDKATPKEQPKPFQPQILRRPQTSEGPIPADSPSPGIPSQRVSPIGPSPLPLASPEQVPVDSRRPSQTDVQKQKLLSLFGGGIDTTPKVSPQPAPPTSGLVSPLTASQLLGSNDPGNFDPISTRSSRVGSMASVVSAAPGTRQTIEKRQTGAENKAFLLGYLGRIASQEK